MQARAASQAPVPSVTSLCVRIAAVEDGVASLQDAVATSTLKAAEVCQANNISDVQAKVSQLEAQMDADRLNDMLQRLSALEAAASADRLRGLKVQCSSLVRHHDSGWARVRFGACAFTLQSIVLC